jgi:Ca2+-binding RTX toxin-like protein
MYSRTFKEVFASVKPDRPASPALSRAERRAKLAPAVAPEVLEGRRQLSGSAQIINRVLVVDGDSNGNFIELFQNGSVVTVAIDFDDPSDFNPGDFDSASVSGLGGNDSIMLDYNNPGVSFTEEAWIDGGDGNDTIQGGDYADTIHGGDGNDVLHGADSADTIYGDDGNDGIYGEVGGDILYGGVGYDTLDGDGDADVIYGGTGSGANSDSVTGYDVIYGGDSDDTLFGEGGGDTIYGEDGADSIRGGDFADLIYGGTGADSMYGDDGDDTIDAREMTTDNDILVGGNGNDCGWWDIVHDSSDVEGRF